jgi:23S rRNA maturation-related 3'-5' exoribonuclease YhaM
MPADVSSQSLFFKSDNLLKLYEFQATEFIKKKVWLVDKQTKEKYLFSL